MLSPLFLQLCCNMIFYEAFMMQANITLAAFISIHANAQPTSHGMIVRIHKPMVLTIPPKGLACILLPRVIIFLVWLQKCMSMYRTTLAANPLFHYPLHPIS